MEKFKSLIDQIDNLAYMVADSASDTANAQTFEHGKLIKEITADFVLKITKAIKEIESANANN